eukprot:TRINITY_DN2859_c0_g1_i3.p1 TRINITY_DN2859_c0_g1~~TRINITY_DN2859_c0_g1_i3.p1  ORF type:complete len:465 (+),score=122.03 TRINITY_DN2859_c0_g1_i3:46-1395(+)
MADPFAGDPQAEAADDEWVEQTDPSSSRVYYVNKRTGESQWDDPRVAPQQQAAAEGWVEAVDPQSGRTFYVNQATGESSWEAPQAADAGQPAASTAQSAGAEPAAASGWVERLDSGSGQTYYVNTETGESVWERPAELAPAAVAPAPAAAPAPAPAVGMPSPSKQPRPPGLPPLPIPGQSEPGSAAKRSGMPKWRPHRCVNFDAGGTVVIGASGRGRQSVAVVPMAAVMTGTDGCNCSPSASAAFRALAEHPGPLWDAEPQVIVDHLAKILPGDGPLRRVLARLVTKPHDFAKEGWGPFREALFDGLGSEDIRSPGDGAAAELRDDPALPVEERLRRALHRERAAECCDSTLLGEVQRLLMLEGPERAAKAALDAGALGLGMTLASVASPELWKESLALQTRVLDPWSPLYSAVMVAHGEAPEWGEMCDPQAWRPIVFALLRGEGEGED